ncbi:MAG TPA: DUF4203 domain-containing protein [Vicinamibacterales bacterium]|nr:DUF4203 domain-containing protein [Vicinamibacterales bacterium]
MLPSAYRAPAAVLLVAGGALACFAGYRLFRLVLGFYGFVLGALVASSAVGGTDPVWLVGSALAGGVAGALILIGAYFIGVALVGALAAAMLLHLAWRPLAGEPHLLLVVAAAIAGAVVALRLQRYVVILVTAFAGAWTVLAGAAALAGGTAGAESGVWVVYPLQPAPGALWVPVAWLVLGAVGAIVQLRVTGARTAVS